MKNLTFIAAAFALSIAPAMAQEAPQISKRAAIYSAEGTKIGRVEKIPQGADGKPESVRIIYRGKFLTIPAASLSAEGNGLKTSLTNEEIKKMRSDGRRVGKECVSTCSVRGWRNH